jgi:hypothetical protein
MPYVRDDLSECPFSYLTLQFSLAPRNPENSSRSPEAVEAAIQRYRKLISSLPPESQHIFFYILDLLSIFDRNSSANLMTASNLAVIFQPGLLQPPHPPPISGSADAEERRAHIDLGTQEHRECQEVLEFLIQHQEDFVQNAPVSSTTTASVAGPEKSREKGSRGTRRRGGGGSAPTMTKSDDVGDGEEADDEDWWVVPGKKTGPEELSRRGSENDHERERRRLRRKSHDQRRIASASSQMDPATGSKVRRSRTLPTRGSSSPKSASCTVVFF